MKNWFLSFALAACFTLTAKAQTWSVLKLTDGRTIENVKFLSQNHSFISVKYTGGIMQIPKSTLPPALQTQFPIDPSAAQVEHEAALTRGESLKQRFEESQAIAIEREKKRQAQFQKDMKRMEAESKAPKRGDAKIAELTPKFCRDQVWIMSADIKMSAAYLTVKNSNEGQKTFDWRELRGYRRDGSVITPTAARPTTGRWDYELSGGQERVYEVGFGGYDYGSGNWLREVTWRQD